MTKHSLVQVALVVGCSACSTVYEGKYARDDGWRRGTVLEVATGGEIAQAGWRDCRKGLSAEALAAHQFATVEFFGSHRKSTITVPVQKGVSLEAGEHVYVDIADCSAAISPRLAD